MKEEFKNPYEHKLVRNYCKCEPAVGQPKRIIVVDLPSESVTVLLQHFGYDLWTYGYVIHFADGREAIRSPSLEYGYCVTETDAVLHFLGLCLSFRTCFSDAAVDAIKSKALSTSQLSLW